MKLLFIIYTDFENILLSELNGKQNSKKSYTNKNHKTYCLQLWLYISIFDDKFSNPFNTCL